MKLKLERFIAILLLVIPGLLATYGFILVKDVIFAGFSEGIAWFKLIFGIILFLIGVAFIGGWVFFRDRKRNYVAPRFKEKKPRRRPRPQSTTEK